jgi:hypothetical protein
MNHQALGQAFTLGQTATPNIKPLTGRNNFLQWQEDVKRYIEKYWPSIMEGIYADKAPPTAQEIIRRGLEEDARQLIINPPNGPPIAPVAPLQGANMEAYTLYQLRANIYNMEMLRIEKLKLPIRSAIRAILELISPEVRNKLEALPNYEANLRNNNLHNFWIDIGSALNETGGHLQHAIFQASAEFIGSKKKTAESMTDYIERWKDLRMISKNRGNTEPPETVLCYGFLNSLTPEYNSFCDNMMQKTPTWNNLQEVFDSARNSRINLTISPVEDRPKNLAQTAIFQRHVTATGTTTVPKEEWNKLTVKEQEKIKRENALIKAKFQQKPTSSSSGTSTFISSPSRKQKKPSANTLETQDEDSDSSED